MWLNANPLALNVSKTNFFIFSAVNKPLKTGTILINRIAIEQKELIKYLGVLIESKLTFKQHTSSLSKKINSRTIGLMYKLRHYVSKKILVMLYYSLIYPFLIYAIPIWRNANLTILNFIHILQKMVVRLITFTDGQPEITGPFAHSAPVFKELNILTVYDTFKIETIKFVFDSLNSNNPLQFHNYFMYPTNPYNTAGNRNNNLKTPLGRTKNYGLKSLKYIGAQIRNDIRSGTSRKQLIKSVKCLLTFHFN